MSINRHLPHLLVIPEDAADRELANGALKNLNVNGRAVQVMPFVGGWPKFENELKSDYIHRLQTYPNGRLLLLVDFDDQGEARRDRVRSWVPNDLHSRVYILGAAKDPEELKRALENSSLESIGDALLEGCPEGVNEHWNSPQLHHNKTELTALLEDGRSYLFS